MATTSAPTPPTTSRIEIAPKTILLIFGLVAVVWALFQLTLVLTVITVALVMVGTFDPLVSWLEHHGLRRGRALVLVFVAGGLVVAGIVLLMIPPLLSQMMTLVANAPKEREHLVKMIDGYAGAKPFVQALNDIPLEDFGKRAAHGMLEFSTELLMVFGYGLSTLFLAIYLLADPTRAKGLLYAVVPRQHHVKLAKILLELKVIVGGYMRGQLITSLSISIFVLVVLLVAGADNALAIALFAGLTDIIPFVGGYVASTPVVVAVSPHGTVAIIVTIVLMVLYQEFESRILVPRVYGRVLRLPPAVVVVALLIGGTLAGILGALLALPIAAGVQMLLRELRVDLPGEAVGHDEDKLRDDKATEMYEQMTEGVPAADAGVIADDLAKVVKRSEEDGQNLLDQLPDSDERSVSARARRNTGG